MDRHFRFAPLAAQRADARRLRRPLLRQSSAAPRPAPSSLMTSGSACFPPISSSSRWNRTARASASTATPVGRATAPITWGGVGTDAQHAVFQLLHQGTHLVPVEFVAEHRARPRSRPPIITASSSSIASRQGAALMAGRAVRDPHRSYPGDRPSTTILLDALDPAHARRADRLLRASRLRQCRSARHQSVRPVRRRARQGDGEASRTAGGVRPVDQALIARASERSGTRRPQRNSTA